jgi:putative ATPase
MSDLFAAQREQARAAVEPLAARMRPRKLDEFVGQRHILGPGMILRRMLDADKLTSIILWGAPGTGKTTLAEVIANHTGRHFERANAAMVGVKDIREILEAAARRLEAGNQRTILFLDEIHRFARNQQDVLLHDVERGLITLIGATTENPYFAVNSALNSRSTILRFEPLSEEDVAMLVRRAIADPRGFGRLTIEIADEAVAHWARLSDGDARRALNALEIAVLSQRASEPSPPARGQDEGDSRQAQPLGRTTAPSSLTPALSRREREVKPIIIDLNTAEQSIQGKALAYDPTGDEHYDVISAFIKSMRGSDPDAAVYWLARMLEAGEDPRFIARRIAILASEDIGNADPRALQVAAAAWEITERIGVPECQLTLAQAAIYMAVAPKSNAATVAIGAAMKDVREGRTLPVPIHLRDAHYAGAKQLGHGEHYVYPHDAADGYVAQDHLGRPRIYYQPVQRGLEIEIARRLKTLRGESAPEQPA